MRESWRVPVSARHNSRAHLLLLDDSLKRADTALSRLNLEPIPLDTQKPVPYHRAFKFGTTTEDSLQHGNVGRRWRQLENQLIVVQSPPSDAAAGRGFRSHESATRHQTAIRPEFKELLNCIRRWLRSHWQRPLADELLFVG